MYFLNGRTNGDLSGYFTCKGVSTVDYFVCSSNIFKCINSLLVLDHCEMLSDVHNPVLLKLNFDYYTNPINVENEPKVKLWDSSKANLFTYNLDMDKINEIFDKLCYTENIETVCQENINIIVNDISNMYKSCSKESFGFNKVKKNDTINIDNNKTWF